MKKSILKLLIVITIISLILMLFAGCKSPDSTELEERIEKLELEKTIKELEDELAKKEAEEASPEEEEESSPGVATDTEQMEEEEDGEEETADANADKEAPTISLAIYEGPALDGSICYYRVEATVTGSPTVSFSKDDSGGAWGSKKVQINLLNPGDTYNLTATATNSGGSATDSLALSWGCAPAPDPIETDVDIGADGGLSGYIMVDLGTLKGPAIVYIGDYKNNQPQISFLSFNISSISGLDDVTIKNVSVTIPIITITNNPKMAGGMVRILAHDYGNSLEYTDLKVVDDLLGSVDSPDSLTNLHFSSNKLEDALQQAVNVDKKWFQLAITLNSWSSNGISDFYSIPVANVELHIKYEVPG